MKGRFFLPYYIHLCIRLYSRTHVMGESNFFISFVGIFSAGGEFAQTGAELGEECSVFQADPGDSFGDLGDSLELEDYDGGEEGGKEDGDCG